MMAVDDQAHRVLATPVTHIEKTMVTFIRDSPYEDGIILGTKFMREHLGKRRGNCHALALIVEESIRRLRPLQDDVRTLMGVVSDETLVEFQSSVFTAASGRETMTAESERSLYSITVAPFIG